MTTNRDTQHEALGFELFSQNEKYYVREVFTLEKTEPFHSADEAIDYCLKQLGDKGGSIHLHRGDYQIEHTIQLSSRITLSGAGRSTRLIASDTGDEKNQAMLLGQGIDRVKIENLAVIGTEDGYWKTGIVLRDCGDCSVTHVCCESFSDYGIHLTENSFLCEISHCRLGNHGKANIFLENLATNGRGGDYVPNLISNCQTYGGGTGVELKRALLVNIVGVLVYQASKHSFHLHSKSNSVLISGCRSFQCGGDAVVVENSHELNISSNIICWQRGHGIVLRRVSWGTVSANEVIDSGVRDPNEVSRHGIFLLEQSRGLSISGNAIFNWGDQVPMENGVYETEDCEKNSIIGNTINFCKHKGVASFSPSSVLGDNCEYLGESFEDFGVPVPDFCRTKIEAYVAENTKTF